MGLDKVVDWLWVGVSAAFAWGWKHIHKRIDVLRADVKVLHEFKADKSELDRQRDHVEKIYDRLDEQGRLLATIDAKVTAIQETQQRRRR